MGLTLMHVAALVAYHSIIDDEYDPVRTMSLPGRAWLTKLQKCNSSLEGDERALASCLTDFP